jgi:hypothetical protein
MYIGGAGTAETVIISRRAQLQTEGRHDGTHSNVNNIAIFVIASRKNTQNFKVRPPEFSVRDAKDLTRFSSMYIEFRLPVSPYQLCMLQTAAGTERKPNCFHRTVMIQCRE